MAVSNIVVDVRCVQTSNKRGQKKSGGLQHFSKLKADITEWMREDNNLDSRFTTMIDLYGLPSDFPGLCDVNMGNQDCYQVVEELERNLAAQFDEQFFVPYIQLHEFEALLLADPAKLADEFFCCEVQANRLVSVVNSFQGNPELVNDGQNTAPSKRIIAEIPAYKKAKAFLGPKVASAIGLSTLRAKCRHFNSWLIRLERLSRG